MRKNIDGQYYQWDDNKNLINKRKHGISFDEAAFVFQDANRLEYLDDLHSDNEKRYITIGKVEEILFVVYTERNEDIRLISARIADKNERKMYYYGADFYC